MLTQSWPARGALLGFAITAMLVSVRPASAGSEFTYQGQLQFEDQPVNATCDFEFSLWNAVSGGTQEGSTLNRTNVTVTNGLFTVQLDFGGAALGSGDRWLQTAVGCVGLSGLVTLTRQPLATAPYAYSADTVISGAVGTAQIASGAVTSAKIASGAVTAANIASGAVGTNAIAPGAVGPTDIGDGAVTSTKIDSGAVTAAKIASGAVGTSAVATGAVTSAKIQDGTITASDVDTTSLQRRITGACAADTAMTYVNEDGTFGCAPTGTLHLPYSDSLSDSNALLSLSNTGSGIGVRGGSDTGRGVFGQSGSNTGVSGTSASGTAVEGVSTNAIGVWGRTGSASADPPSFIFPVTPGVYGNGDARPGVLGVSVSAGGVLGTSVSSSGVSGFSSGSGNGVTGLAGSGVGVYGTSSSGFGVEGESSGAYAVYGRGTGASTKAVYGVNTNNGNVGELGSEWGAYGKHEVTSNAGYLGTEDAGVEGRSDTETGVYGVTALTGHTRAGVKGQSTGSNGIGVIGIANVGTDAYGVYGESTSGFAGYFEGNVKINGTIMKGGGGFQIDHPLDPANKYLAHSFVESPDMKNVYDGVAVLDEAGEAVVTLPDWFEALNRDFRYQLTCVGGFAPVYIAEEVAENQFRIAGGDPGLKVSWQVTGIRHDAFANAHPIAVEEEKTAGKQGLYLNPVE